MTIVFTPHLERVLKDGSGDGFIVRRTTRNGREYTVIRYDKKALTGEEENVLDIGRFRSVIVEGDRIRCVAPPKSLDTTSFKSSLSENGCRGEQFVEGTMINVFHDSSLETSKDLGRWEIATRSCVGADTRFFSWTTKTFRQMFVEALVHVSGRDDPLADLDTGFFYSMVLQHPENRIVTPFAEPALYLVAAYRVTDDGLGVENAPCAMRKALETCRWLRSPEVYATGGAEVVQKLQDEWQSGAKNYEEPGVMLHDDQNRTRSKIRNPAYENVRRLRGNQPKLQYRYLSLSSEERSEYVRYYPEAEEAFREYGAQVEEFSRELHSAYMQCKVRREVPLSNVPSKFRTHVYHLHGEYVNTLRSEGKIVTRDVVRDYVNGVPAALLMHGINR